jgi:PAS domain S-box-containing protein
MSIETTVKQYAPQIAMTVSTIFAITKYGPVIWKATGQMIRLISALEAIALLPARVEALSAQFQRNGGSSLRDAVDNSQLLLKQFGESLEELRVRNHTHWRMDYSASSWEADSQGRWVAANMKLCEMLEVSEEDLIGMNWKNLIYFQDADRTFATWSRVVLEHSHLNISARCHIPSRGSVMIRFKAQAMKVNGRVVGWIGTAESEATEET